MPRPISITEIPRYSPRNEWRALLQSFNASGDEAWEVTDLVADGLTTHSIYNRLRAAQWADYPEIEIVSRDAMARIFIVRTNGASTT